MDFKVAYDFDGVLAIQPPDVGLSWRYMNGEQRRRKKEWLVRWYTAAPQLFIPEESRFVVITARKNTEEIRKVSEDWLRARFPDREIVLEMLDQSRNIENVVKFKSDILRKYRVEDYTEDNWKVVSLLRKELSGVRVWHYKGSKQLL